MVFLDKVKYLCDTCINTCCPLRKSIKHIGVCSNYIEEEKDMARGIKLDNNTIFKIYKLVVNEEPRLTYVEIAERFSIDPSTIYKIVRDYKIIDGELWKKIKL
jgi:DNA invertase Pin-like site-specific DNA recombinase